MRDTILASLFLASASLASASSPLECLQTEVSSSTAPCGNQATLKSCLDNIPESTLPDSLPQHLEQCLQSAGCTAAESQLQALLLLSHCDPSVPRNDLRRGRRNAPSPEADSSALSALAAQALGARDPAVPLITAMADAPAPNRILPRATTIAARSSPSPCFTDVTSTVEHCEKNVCTPRVVTNQVCADGLICRVDNHNVQSCMYKESKLDTAGIIIAICFAAAIAISVIAICFMCCRERREHRRIERAAEAARIAKEATVAAKRPGVSVTGGTGVGGASGSEGQPLMYQAPAAGASETQYQPQQYQQEYQPQTQGAGGYGGGAPNPFADAHDGHPLR